MRDTSFRLELAASTARPPFTYRNVASTRASFWKVHEVNGRAVGRAKTRAGARAAVRALYEKRQDAEAAAAMRGTT